MRDAMSWCDAVTREHRNLLLLSQHKIYVEPMNMR
jgi:hypothetical protein